MRRTGILASLALAATMSIASQASAMTFGGEVYGAFNTVSMKDWNDAIDQANASGSSFENVNNGFTGGINLRLWANPNWLFMAGWEPLFISTEDSSTPGDKLTLDANAFTATGAYFFPTGGNAKYGVGAGVGFYQNSGKLESAGSPDVDIQGNGVGFHFLGLGEWTVSPGFAVTGGAGYRVANLSNTEFSDGTTTADSPYDNDYSGFMGRVGLAFYMPSGSGQ